MRRCRREPVFSPAQRCGSVVKRIGVHMSRGQSSTLRTGAGARTTSAQNTRSAAFENWSPVSSEHWPCLANGALLAVGARVEP